VRVDSDPPQNLVADGALDVGGGLRGGTLAHGVLLVVQQAHVDPDGLEGVEEGGDRTVAGAGQGRLLAVDGGLDGEGVHAVAVGGGLAVGDLDAAPGVVRVRQVLVVEDGPDGGGGDLVAVGVRRRLYDLRDLDAHPVRQVQRVVVLQDVAASARAGLRVVADDVLVGAADVLGVDGHVRDGPLQVVDGDALGL